MSLRLNDIEYLEELVNTGRSLRAMAGHFHCGKKFLLKRLQKFNLVDKNLTVEDCKVPGWGTRLKNIENVFTYQEYIDRHIKGKESLTEIAMEKEINYNNFKYVARKYKNRFEQDQAKSTV